MLKKHRYFFGYGSLVNRDTHAFQGAYPAQLSGWRRVWRHTKLREVAYLTVVPDATAEIDGLIAEVPDDDWAALDIREGAYDRVDAAHQVAHPLPHRPQIAVYAIPDGKHGAPTTSGPVLLSYIDVVVQGYLREFGEDGARRFFETTLGWDAPILRDRDAPLYPRHCRLSKAETGFVDAQLEALEVRFITRR
ncbi:gamma-glutamylcyclotransferase family protein [Roseovarius faecimaris]|nr:gamma-glutamylcyclotransferase family protein [Roseovarius faecimaris]